MESFLYTGKMEPSLRLRHIEMLGKWNRFNILGKWMQIEPIQYVGKMELFQHSRKMDRHEPNR